VTPTHCRKWKISFSSLEPSGYNLMAGGIELRATWPTGYRGRFPMTDLAGEDAPKRRHRQLYRVNCPAPETLGINEVNKGVIRIRHTTYPFVPTHESLECALPGT